MTKRELIDHLLYLDNDYVSTLYEVVTGKSSASKITRTEGMTAGVRIPLFSGGASSHESRSYEISTTFMLHEILKELSQIPTFTDSEIAIGKKSVTRWLSGSLSVLKVVVTRRQHRVTLVGKPTEPENRSDEKTVGEEKYFAINCKGGTKFALVTSPEYFVSGVDALAELNGTVVEQVSIPINALLRIYAAQSSFSEWIAVPLVIFEDEVKS